MRDTAQHLVVFLLVVETSRALLRCSGSEALAHRWLLLPALAGLLHEAEAARSLYNLLKAQPNRKNRELTAPFQRL